MTILTAPIDNGGRRTGNDRRKFSYSGHIPEKRSGDERRCGEDRRNRTDFDLAVERRAFFSS